MNAPPIALKEAEAKQNVNKTSSTTKSTTLVSRDSPKPKICYIPWGKSVKNKVNENMDGQKENAVRISSIDDIPEVVTDVGNTVYPVTKHTNIVNNDNNKKKTSARPRTAPPVYNEETHPPVFNDETRRPDYDDIKRPSGYDDHTRSPSYDDDICPPGEEGPPWG